LVTPLTPAAAAAVLADQSFKLLGAGSRRAARRRRARAPSRAILVEFGNVVDAVDGDLGGPRRADGGSEVGGRRDDRGARCRPRRRGPVGANCSSGDGRVEELHHISGTATAIWRAARHSSDPATIARADRRSRRSRRNRSVPGRPGRARSIPGAALRGSDGGRWSGSDAPVTPAVQDTTHVVLEPHASGRLSLEVAHTVARLYGRARDPVHVGAAREVRTGSPRARPSGSGRVRLRARRVSGGERFRIGEVGAGSREVILDELFRAIELGRDLRLRQAVEDGVRVRMRADIHQTSRRTRRAARSTTTDARRRETRVAPLRTRSRGRA